MGDFKLQRLGILMEPEPGNKMEAEGVLNPAAVRGPDGGLYLFPRMVAKGNYSRIGIARVKFDKAGDPVGVERLGIALEPEEDYEKRPGGGGGCEDPRVTYVEQLKHYIMTYVAFSPVGPRIALARSTDLIHWERLGLTDFSPYKGIDFNGIDDKDSCVFPKAVPNPSEYPEFALIHRPLFPGTSPEEKMRKVGRADMDVHRESIWISYSPHAMNGKKSDKFGKFISHHHLACPVSPWEELKIGCGTPPVLTKHGWMLIYHGISEDSSSTVKKKKLCYSAGIMILEKEHPQHVLYRSAEPILTPELPEEKVDNIAKVVFPTGIDRRDDLGQPNRFDIYYGMADDRIGVARLDLPNELPAGLPPEKLRVPIIHK